MRGSLILCYLDDDKIWPVPPHAEGLGRGTTRTVVEG
jgi:hypothetical protein